MKTRMLCVVLLFCASAFGITNIINSFVAGEISRLLDGRTDLKAYFSGCRTLENMLVFSQGGATRRPGTKYIATIPETVDFPISVYLGYYPASASASISKYESDYSLDADWATNGNWPFIYSTWSFHCMANTADGGMIVGHNDYTDANIPTYSSRFTNGTGGTISAADTITSGAKSATCLAIRYTDSTTGVIYWNSVTGTNFVNTDVVTNGTASVKIANTVPAYGIGHVLKLTSAGAIDTTWGYNGYAHTRAGYPVSIAIDNGHNSYIGFYNADDEQIVKFNAQGTLQWTFGFGASGPYIYGMECYDYGSVPILVCAIGYKDVGGTYYNVVAINRNTGAIATTWGTSGYANPTSTSAISAYAIRMDSTNSFYIHHGATASVCYSLTKLTSAGAIDTTWGTSGRSGADEFPVWNSKYSWNNTLDLIQGQPYTLNYNAPAAAYDRTTVYLCSYASDGTETKLKTISGLGNEPVKCITGGGGTIFLGGNSVDLEGDGASTVHYYEYDATYLGKFTNTTAVTHIVKESYAPQDTFYVDNDVQRLIPFEYSTDDAYIIEAGNQYMRFYRDGAQILNDANDAYTIWTPYDEYELADIQYIQSADTMYIVDGNDAPRQLTRTGHAAWTLAAIDFEDGPFLDENATTTTITPSGTTGSVTLTGSANIWNANHVGALWEVTHIVDENSVSGTWSNDATSDTVTVQKDRIVTFMTSGIWQGLVTLQRSYDDGSTWEDVMSRFSHGDNNVSYAEAEGIDECLYRVTYDETLAWEDGRLTYNLTAEAFENRGVVEITGYTSATSVTGTVQRTLGSTDATEYWAEGAWSDDEGWPRTVSFYEERCVYGGTSGSPQTLWFSVVDDWNNFLAGEDDSDALTYKLSGNQVAAIRWLCPNVALLVGTTGGEWKVWSGSMDEPLTPTKPPQCRMQTNYGSEAVAGINVNNAVLFVQRCGRKIRELVYSFELDSYVAPDLTVLAEHVTEGGITEMALQKNPDPIVWCVRDDGTLCGLTYNREQEVVAWTRQELGGSGAVESVAVIPGDGEDEVWVAVARTVDGNDVRYIEQFQPRDFGDDVNDAFFVDCGISYDGTAATTFTGADHLEGATVDVVADGNYTGTEVIAGGSFTIDTAACVVHAGYGYDSRLQPMRLEVPLSDGTSQGRIRRIITVTGRFHETSSCTIGDSWDDLYDFEFSDENLSDRLYTGDERLPFGGGYDRKGDICIEQAEPMPMTLLALIPEWEVN